METNYEEDILIRIAVTLNKLLEANRNLNNSVKNDPVRARSYNQIALNAEIRKATVSNIFNAHTSPQVVTLFSIIEAMGFTLKDFAEIYQNLTSSDTREFKNDKKSRG